MIGPENKVTKYKVKATVSLINNGAKVIEATYDKSPQNTRVHANEMRSLRRLNNKWPIRELKQRVPQLLVCSA